MLGVIYSLPLANKEVSYMYIRRSKAIRVLAIGITALCALFTAEASAKLQVVTTFSQDASIVSAIGGGFIEVVSLTNGLQDPHAVEPKPSLAAHLSRADLLIVNGQQMELAWLPAALAAVGNPRIQEGGEGYLNASAGVRLIPYTTEELEGTQFVPFLGEDSNHHKVGNHHFWLDPANGLIIARNVYRKLAKMDPKNDWIYKLNYESFTARLTEKMKDWDALMVMFRGVKIVSYHRDWIYLTNRHGLEIVAYIEPRETIPPSAGDAARLIKLVKDKDIPLILISPWQPQRASREIARQSGAKVLSLPSAVDSRLGTRDYIQLFDVIYTQLSRALFATQIGTQG